MYEVNGQEVTLEVLQGKAKEYGMDFDSYMEAMKKKGLVEKTPGSQTEDATASQVDTASISDDGSSAFPYDDTKDKHDVLLNITTKDKNLQGNFITKPNYAFFDKSEEDAIGDLVMKYPGFEFEETNIIGDDRSSFNAIKVSKGDKSIKVEFNIDGGASTDDPRTLEAVGKYNQEGIDSLNTAEKGLLISYQSKNQAYKKSYEDLTSFIDENSTSEDDKLYLKQNQERSALTLDFLEKTKPTEDQLNTIETDIVNNEDLFKVKEEEVNLFRGVGMDAKIGVAPRSYVKKTQPYAKELQQTEKKLIANGVKPEDITRDLVEQKTRDYLARIANKEAWNKNTEVSLEELDDIDQIKVAYNRDYSLTPTIKDKIELGLKEFEKEYVAKIVHRDALQEQLKEGKLANKLKTAVERFDSEDYDFTQVKMQPGEGLITLDTGKQIPESVYGQYQKDYKEYNELYNNYLELSSDIVKNLDNGFINRVPEQLDLTRRNYNAVEEAVVETGLGFLEMAVDAGYGTAKLFGDPSLNDDAQIEFKNKINNIRQSYKRDVEFDDAFSSLENFVSFATQEAVNQVPIFTALATPMGWGLIGTSSFGSQYSDMVKQDKEIGATKTSNAEKYFKSLGYAGAELVFGAAPTYMLIRDAKKALVNNVAKNAMEKIKVGEYVKNNLITPNTFTAVAGEPIGEGLTQLTQNAINGRPLTEGVDHAMFSGLMFGPTLASVPFFKGLYLSQFSDADTKQQIRIFRAEQVELGKTNEQLKRGGKSISDKVQQRKDKIFNENQNRIEELQELINLEVQATESKVKTLSNKAAEAYISLISAQESTRLEAQEVRKDGFLSEKQKNDKLLLLKQKFDNLQDNLEQFRKSDTYNNNWSLFEADDKNKSEVDRLRKEAELALLEQEGITDVNEEQINDKARIMYNTEVILKDIAKKTKRKTTALRNTLVSHETVEETIEYLEKDAKEKINNLDPSLSETQRQRVVESVNNNLANNISEVQQGAHGFMISNSNNEDVSVVNVENMAKDDRLETKTHELQHVVFANAIGLDDSSYIGLAEQVLMWTEQNNKDAYQRINTFAERNSDGSYPFTEENVKEFSEFCKNSGGFTIG